MFPSPPCLRHLNPNRSTIRKYSIHIRAVCSFFSVLIDSHPEWNSLAQCRPSSHAGCEGQTFYAEVPCPSTRIGKLWISTEQGVIVGFGDLYHMHFYTYEPETDSAVFRRAVQFIDEFMQEQHVIVVGLVGERPGGSWVSPSAEAGTIPEWFRSSAPFDSLRIFSWNGSLDRDVDLTKR